jgi:spore germination protein KC
LLKKIIILIFIISTLTGCWNRRELNDIAITIAMGIDKVDEEFMVTVQIINPGEIAGSDKTNRTPVSTYTERAPTIFEALRKLTTVSPRKLYLSHIRVVIIGEELASEGIKNVLDFLNRDHEMRTNFFLLIAKGYTAYDVLNILTPMEQIPANKLFSSIKTSQDAYAATSYVTLDDYIKDYKLEGTQPVITGLKIVGDKQDGSTQKNVESIKSSAVLKYEGLGIFKEDKLIGWLDEAESKGYNYLTGNVKNSVGHVECPFDENGKVTIELVNVETSIKGNIAKNKPEIIIDAWGEGNIGEVACNFDFKEKGAINKVEKMVNKKFRELLNKAITKAKENQVDIFGFGEVIRRTDPDFWQENKNEWEESYFEELKINIDVTFNIRRTGTIDNSFYFNGEE